MTPPDWLNRTSKNMWKKLAAELEARGDLTESTSEALAIAIQAYQDYRLCNDLITEHGLTVVTASTVKPNPAVGIRKTCEETFIRYLDNLLLLPKGKGKIVGKLADTASELDNLFGG